MAPPARPVKVIAFYLPQFHPIPENDAWWGPGFTEWTNVKRATPQFAGHEQPRLPGELGFYDLRAPEVQIRQGQLANDFGVHGFCYYTYWFGGRRLLERPLELLLAEPRIERPFCLCYANPSWTRRWDGQEQDRLITQQHTPEDDLAFIRSLFPYLRDPRYIRVEGKPLLIVYLTRLFPDMRATAARWREACHQAGIGDLFLTRVEAFGELTPPAELGFDAACEFPPHNLDVPMAVVPATPGFEGAVFDYRLAAASYQRRVRPAHTLFRCVAPGWDNTPRRLTRATILKDSSPEAYFDWLSFAIEDTLRHNQGDRRLVFINAWNEWGEGAHLEPCARHGRRYLEATRDALAGHAAAPATEVAEALRSLTARYERQAAELVRVRGELEEARRVLSRLDMRVGHAAYRLARRGRELLRSLRKSAGV